MIATYHHSKDLDSNQLLAQDVLKMTQHVNSTSICTPPLQLEQLDCGIIVFLCWICNCAPPTATTAHCNFNCLTSTSSSFLILWQGQMCQTHSLKIRLRISPQVEKVLECSVSVLRFSPCIFPRYRWQFATAVELWLAAVLIDDKWLKIFNKRWSNKLKVIFLYSDVVCLWVYGTTQIEVSTIVLLHANGWLCFQCNKWTFRWQEQHGFILSRTNSFCFNIKGSRGDLLMYHVNFPHNFPVSRNSFKGAGTESWWHIWVLSVQK